MDLCLGLSIVSLLSSSYPHSKPTMLSEKCPLTPKVFLEAEAFKPSKPFGSQFRSHQLTQDCPSLPRPGGPCGALPFEVLVAPSRLSRRQRVRFLGNPGALPEKTKPDRVKEGFL